MGGGDPAAAAASESAAPATTGDAAPAVASAAVPAAAVAPSAPAIPDPVAPWVEAAQTRRKIPYWAVPVLALLPLWAVVYALTLDPPTPTEPGPLELGAEVYATNCAGCHGATGGGAGAVPALNLVAEHFEQPADMVTWVALATSGYRAAGIEEYAPGVAVGPNLMPPWIDSLTAEELMSVVLYERTQHGGEEFDAAVWEEGWEESLSALLPMDKVEEYTAVLEEWKADPPACPGAGATLSSASSSHSASWSGSPSCCSAAGTTALNPAPARSPSMRRAHRPRRRWSPVRHSPSTTSHWRRSRS